MKAMGMESSDQRRAFFQTPFRLILRVENRGFFSMKRTTAAAATAGVHMKVVEKIVPMSVVGPALSRSPGMYIIHPRPKTRAV